MQAPFSTLKPRLTSLMKQPAFNALPDTCGNFLRLVDADALCKAALGTVLFHDIMQGILGKAGGLLNFTSEFP